MTPIEKRFGRDTARAVRQAFRNLALPVPEQDEFCVTSDGGFLVLANDLGCALRLSNDAALPARHHKRVHQAVAERPVGLLRMDVNPGIQSPSFPDDAEFDAMMQDIERAGLRCIDISSANFGRLPAVPGISAFEYHVVIDPGAIGSSSRWAHYSDTKHDADYYRTEEDKAVTVRRETSMPAMPDDFQDRLYAPLRQAFAAAWPCKSDRANPTQMKTFHALCQTARDKGRLMNAWLGTGKGLSGRDYQGSSVAYAAHCAAFRQA